jgi:hypothetical protein
MKKLFLGIVLTICVFPTVSNAQNSKGTSLLNVGIGLNSWGIPLHGSFEYMFTDKISAGFGIDYARRSIVGWTSGHYNYLFFGARANYLLNELLKIEDEKLVLYGGVTLGYFSANYSGDNYIGTTTYGSAPFYGGQIGGRYALGKNLTGFAEVGVGASFAKAGLSFKF